MKKLTIVIDENSCECLYIDGKSWPSKGEMTVYACDIASAAGGEPVLISHESIDFYHEQWPDTLEAALSGPGAIPI